MLIAIPTDTPGGLDATISEHFGHCAAFTVVEVSDGAIGDVTVVANSEHEHGGCMAPVGLLKDRGVDVLLAGGIGARPLAGFEQVGIAVHSSANAPTVRAAIQLYAAGGCPRFDSSNTCGGGGGGCGGHGHQQVERPPIEGPADARDGRVVTFSYELRDGDGALLDSSDHGGPMRYVHGASQLLPALERGLEGLEPGGHKVIEIPRAEAFGDHDPSCIVEAPRSELPPDAEVGSMLTAMDESGQRLPLVVVHLDEQTAKLDGNHPLAGKDLRFTVSVVSVESATPDEIAHGHVH